MVKVNITLEAKQAAASQSRVTHGAVPLSPP